MSKILMWILVAGVVVGGIYSVFFVNKVELITESSDLAGGTELEGSPKANSMDPAGKKMAFSEFMKTGGSYQCTVSQNVSGAETTAKIYLNGKLVRVEATTNVPNFGNIDSTIIVRDDYTYTWTSQSSTTGYKTKTVTEVSSGENSSQLSFDASQIGDYDCDAWTADASKFTVPTNITFTDLSTPR
jgi:hypothetical protein